MAKKATSAWTTLQRRSATLRRSFEGLVHDFLQLAKSDTADLINGWGVATRELEEWKKLITPGSQEVEPAMNELGRGASELLENLDERVVRMLGDAGMNVYGEKTPLVINGIVHAEIDTLKAFVRINGRIATDISLAGLRKEILDELDRVLRLSTPPDKFIEALLRGYEAERQHLAKDFGSQVQISGVLLQLAMQRQQSGFRSNPVVANFREYPREIFRADLFRLLESNLTDTEGKRFRYASGSDNTGAVFMFVPQLGRTAHIGRIWFEHAD